QSPRRGGERSDGRGMRRVAQLVLPFQARKVVAERWPSGRRRTLGKRVYGNVSWVRIPPSPPIRLDDPPPRSADHVRDRRKRAATRPPRRRGAPWTGGAPTAL